MQFSSLTRLALVLMAGATISAAGMAKADPLPANGMTAEDVNSWLRAKGCETQVGDKGDYVACKANNHVFVAFLADCENSRCKSMQFFYGIKFDNGVRPDDASADAFINAWNLNYRWIKASVTPTRDVALEMDYLMSPGGTTEGLNGSLGIFLTGVGVFQNYVDGKTTNGQ